MKERDIETDREKAKYLLHQNRFIYLMSVLLTRLQAKCLDCGHCPWNTVLGAQKRLIERLLNESIN